MRVTGFEFRVGEPNKPKKLNKPATQKRGKMGNICGYYGTALEINLTTGTSTTRSLPAEDLLHFVGGRGLGMAH